MGRAGRRGRATRSWTGYQQLSPALKSPRHIWSYLSRVSRRHPAFRVLPPVFLGRGEVDVEGEPEVGARSVFLAGIRAVLGQRQTGRLGRRGHALGHVAALPAVVVIGGRADEDGLAWWHDRQRQLGL